MVDALRENKIAISDAYEISKAVDREGQLRLLALRTRVQAGKFWRRKAASSERRQRLPFGSAKIKCPLPSGAGHYRVGAGTEPR